MATLTLRSYLDTRRTTAADWNVTGMGTGPNGWTGKFKIPDDEYDAFLTLAHDHIFEKGRACSLLEKHKPNSPILIDLDFRYPAGGPLRRRFTEEDIRSFVAAYADAFARFFGPLPDATPLRFFVMLKPAAEADPTHDAHKDGVHIVCPTVTTSPEIQYAIRGYLLQTGAIERIFGATGMTNPPQDCLDISVVQRNNWFLYGACKPDKAWYKVEHVYSVAVPEEAMTIDADCLEEESLDAWSPLDLVKLLSIRNGHDTATALELRTESGTTEAEWLQLLARWGKGSNWAKAKSPGLFAKMPSDGGDMTPLTLSGGGGGAGAAAAGAGAEESDMIQISGFSVKAGGYSAEEIALAFKLARECLNPTRRCKDYSDWVGTGMLLHNISDTVESMRVWADISRRVPGYEKTPDSVYTTKWNLFPPASSAHQRGRRPLQIGTLYHWARDDSPAVFNSIHEDRLIHIAMINDNGSHVGVAEVVFKNYEHEFKCAPGRKGATLSTMEWYQFPENGHSWESMLTSMWLRARLSKEVRDIYFKSEKRVIDRIIATTNEDERESLGARLKNIRKIEAQLQNSGFKDSVMKELTEKFYDERFLESMNQNTTLVGFSNGVIELRHNGSDGKPHVHFRPGRDDDCISFQMGRSYGGMDAIPYILYDPAAPAPEHLEVLDFFAKIYPDSVLRDYALTLYAACLEGANHEQKFYIMSGSGGNGKSKIIDLMSKTFGEYQHALPVQALTRKRADAGNATPEMIGLKCKRFISMVEPEEGEKINTSLMKQLSGQDVLKARGLFQDQDEFIVSGRIFMSCNDLPAISSMDEGTWRRICVLPHVAKFVPADVPINPAANIHHRDPLLDSKITRWRPYFAGMLVWYYENRYLRGGLKEPTQVTAASSKYKEENDSFAAFSQDCLVKDAGGDVRLNDVLARYKDWYKFNPGRKQLQKKDIQQKLEEKFGKPVSDGGRSNVFVGVRLVMEGEEEDVSGGYIGHTY